ncbi:Gfo/Idh/MocA family oxidoreductase [Sphingomonas sp. R-74633]|uniref:Gfo/Idh/MocA family protein n=1 Tax=Sphingomonas sp. R-74633 TaxID=2751188 RepID=UPI0015D12922|nr:Gfo/Idh/MocA family oxidoreductase [Sphingomonas sp. R-74633]NYT39223.1 Gfo/Idh/MocA family oxidoreductase [Sphingomonas sp. R-74633]
MPTSPLSSTEAIPGAGRATVIGFGSIGQRHARILEELGCQVSVVSRRPVEHPRGRRTLEETLETDRPDYVVIANETAAHYDTLAALAALGFEGRVLIEKPAFQAPCAVPAHRFAAVSVAYNLRFHPGLQKLRALLQGETLISTNIYVGQYLPDWRPGTDYRTSYSADASLGGGALRDLSHDLDYAGWLLGRWRSVAALGGHFSDLEIASDDVYALLLQTASCPVVTVQMSYLDRAARRQLVINTQAHTYALDLVAHTLTVDGVPEALTVDRDTTYREMHKALLAGADADACSLEDGLDTLRLIDAAERATERREWVAG